MIRSDVVVIGGGFAGLTAALAAAKRGQTVTLLTYGEGTLPLNSGVIDVLGYDENHNFVENPIAAIEQLPETHPYRKIGVKALQEAVEFFCGVARKNHIPYHGSLDHQMMVPTAIGTLKPTCLTPHSLSGSEVFPGKKKIVVVGIKGLKDFYGDIMMENLKKALGEGREYQLVEVDTGLTGGRDITTQDVARWLDTDAGTASFTKQLKAYGGETDVLFIVPQVLGTKGHACYQTISSRLGTDVLETTCLPPSVNGMRLCDLLDSAGYGDGPEGVRYEPWTSSVDEDGITTYASSICFGDGEYRLPVVRAVDLAGNESCDSPGFSSFVVDTKAPAVTATASNAPSHV